MVSVNVKHHVYLLTETVGLLGTGAQDVHLNFHTAPELWASPVFEAVYTCDLSAKPVKSRHKDVQSLPDDKDRVQLKQYDHCRR